VTDAGAGARLSRRLEFLAADPGNPRLRGECADLAHQALAAGDVAGAIGAYQSLLEAGESAPALRYNLGYALMLAGRHAEAKQVLTPAAAEMPEAARLLVRAHHHLGELDEAIRLAESQAAARPEDGELSGQLAMLYLDADDFEQARVWTGRALAAPRKTAEACFTAGFLALGDEDEERAQALLGQALELNPKSGRAWAGKGLAAMLGGDLQEGEEALRRAVQYMPGHIGTWHALAWCQLLRGELDAAEASFRQAYEIDRAFSETHGGLAVIELLRGSAHRAQRRARTSLRLDPRSFSGQYAKVLLESKSDQARAEGVRRILASQRALGGGTLVDMVARQAGRGRKKPPA
jgi:tetratricopeptide (TPR) repeat protein